MKTMGGVCREMGRPEAAFRRLNLEIGTEKGRGLRSS